MFEFLFKYPRRRFRKGQFVLLGAWPKWALVAGDRWRWRRALAWLIRSRLARAATAIAKLASGYHLAACNSALATLAADVAVAAGHHGGGAEAAAEHHRRPGGRFAQHGHRERRHHALAAGRECACRAACSRSCRRNFRRACIASTASLTRIARPEGSAGRRRPPRTSATASNSSRRKRPTCPSARWCCSATAPTIPAASTSTPSPRFATATSRFTRSASAASTAARRRNR